MHVYVATSFLNLTEARATMCALRQAGHPIAYDWTEREGEAKTFLERRGVEHDSPEWYGFLEECGRDDHLGVLRADALVLLNHPLAFDAMTETGMAIGAGIPVFVLFPERRHSVFFGLPGVLRVSSLDELLEKLAELEELQASDDPTAA